MRHVIRADVPNRLSVSYGRRRVPYKPLELTGEGSFGNRDADVKRRVALSVTR
jgi:hypothetical protein